ncbi:MAG: hypothetical protein KBA95_18530 [Acidobacteria bacterium]|nr:hypothetical protein [Acidobacteriota bacterium]
MSEEFSLLDLAPAPLVFRDEAFGGDGARHEWRMLAGLGLEDLGTLKRIQDDLGRASALLGKAAPTADELDRTAARLAEGLDAFLRLMLPTLPRERLGAIPLRGKQYMLERWRAAQPAEEAQALPLGEGAAAPPTPRGRPSRGSSPPTA